MYGSPNSVVSGRSTTLTLATQNNVSNAKGSVSPERSNLCKVR